MLQGKLKVTSICVNDTGEPPVRIMNNKIPRRLTGRDRYCPFLAQIGNDIDAFYDEWAESAISVAYPKGA